MKEKNKDLGNETQTARELPDAETGLVPCPFCGDSRSTVTWEHCPPLSKGDTNRLWFVECDRCGAQGPVQNRENQVKNPWNKRAPLTATNTRDLEGATRTPQGLPGDDFERSLLSYLFDHRRLWIANFPDESDDDLTRHLHFVDCTIQAVQDQLRAIPQGNDYRTNRYDTDNEIVLSVWTDGKTFDIRLPKTTETNYLDAAPVSSHEPKSTVEEGKEKSVWIRTSERAPTKEDASDQRIWTVIKGSKWPDKHYWWAVAKDPESYPFWMPIPALPEGEKDL